MNAVVTVVIGIGIAILVIQIIVGAQRNARLSYYCDTCSRSLGTGRHRERVCPRCGDVRYYTREREEP